MKALFLDKLGVTFDSKETVLELNGVVLRHTLVNQIDAFQIIN